MTFILASVTNTEVAKIATSFFAMKIIGSCLNSDLFITILANNLTNVLLDKFLPTRIVCYIDSKSRVSKSIKLTAFLLWLRHQELFEFKNLIL